MQNINATTHSCLELVLTPGYRTAQEDSALKKHILLITNLIIVFFIVAGFTAVVFNNTLTYQDLAERHLENVVSLADMDISKYIENTMDKPVMVSKTMANDAFLKKWLSHEPENTQNKEYLDQLFSYLKAYQTKYDYTTVFCISDKTGNYYYQDGLNKTISPNDQHDVWYYNFVNLGHEYDLEVDTNEKNKNTISIFVNFRVTDDGGNLLGVIGVGFEVASIEDVIKVYEDTYDLAVFIINVRGAENSFKNSTNVFIGKAELAARTGIEEEIVLNMSGESNLQWFSTGGERKCLITKYDDTLGWYLVFEKDTVSITRSFQQSIKGNIVFMLISLMACIFATTCVVLVYNQRLIVAENTDELTGLANRKLFIKQYPKLLARSRGRKRTMFMFDIDHFKDINDTHGHVFGNTVLTTVGRILRNVIDGKGIAARWGGDEFLGVLKVGPEEAEQILNRFMQLLRDEDSVTVSMGLAEIKGKTTTDQMIKMVDEALYNSKKTGRNQITKI